MTLQKIESQMKKFQQAAKGLGCDESEESFVSKPGKIATATKHKSDFF